MTNENIKALLVTICQYNTVRITQTFSKDDTDWIRVKCLPGTTTLELRFLETGIIEHHDSIDEAASAIEKSIYSHTTA